MTRATEKDEIRYRIARKMFELVDMVKPTRIIIACDNRKEGKRNYWREGYLARYYATHTKLQCSRTTLGMYVTYNNAWFPYEDGVIGGKLTKKATPKDLQDADTALTTKEVEAFAPKYKGTRKASEWVFDTSREEMDEIFNEAALDLTGLFPDCRIVDAELAEADDIAGVLVGMSHQPHTLATVDSDWHQLIDSPRVTVLDIRGSVPVLVERTPEEVKYDLMVKIVQGDSGDGVAGTWVDGKAGCLGEVKAKIIVDTEAYDTLDASALERNSKLITLGLDTIPKFVQSNILRELKACRRGTKKTTWEEFTLVKREQDILTNTGSVLSQKYSPSSTNVEPIDEEEELPF